MTTTRKITIAVAVLLPLLFPTRRPVWALDSDKTGGDETTESDVKNNQPRNTNHTLWLETGLGTPVGGYGLRYQLHLPFMSPGLQIGRGFSGEHIGANIAVYPWTPVQTDEGPSPETFLELSYSAAFQSDHEHQFPKGTYHWLHLGGGVDLRISVLSITFSGGAMVLLHGPSDAHVDVADVSVFNFDGFTPVPWLRLGIGVGF